jgi:hypothetical protein
MTESTWLVKIEVDTREHAEHLANHLDLYFSTDWLYGIIPDDKIQELQKIGTAPAKPTIEMEELEC